MNKAIYCPAGKAAEYAKWACNFYVGCSNGCTYCYLKKGRGAAILGGDKPTLKKCFRDDFHALDVFEKELKANLPELQKSGLFFSFSTDPLLPETIDLTFDAVEMCLEYKVPVKILTKVVTDEFENYYLNFTKEDAIESKIAFGFTLTGHDELEPGASTNRERIEAMKKLHDAGFRTFASIEPVIDFESSFRMIEQTLGFCDLYKIGLMSGAKPLQMETRFFVDRVSRIVNQFNRKVYWKQSIVSVAGKFDDASSVDRDYNIFNQ